MCPSVLGRTKWAKMNLRGPKVVPNGPSASKSYHRKGGKKPKSTSRLSKVNKE